MVESEVQLYFFAEDLIESGAKRQAAVIHVLGLVAFIDDGELQLRMLEWIQLQRSFRALRAGSYGAAERIEEPGGGIHVARLEIAVEERQRLRNRQLISVAVV